jgi:hypothetical protein
MKEEIRLKEEGKNEAARTNDVPGASYITVKHN